MSAKPRKPQARAGRSPAKRKQGGGLAWTLPLVGVVLAVIVFLALSRSQGGSGAGLVSQPAPAAVTQHLAQIPAKTWGAVGAQSALPPKFVPTAAGAPTVLYIGAEYCPYCAAERWPLTVALSRFGTFSGLGMIHSSSTDVYPNTPTFTFVGSTYRSAQVRLQTVEYQSDINVPLQTPTATQQAIWQKYDAPPYLPANEAGSIPFLLVGGRYLWVGTTYSPQLLAGQTWQAVAATLPAGTGAAARAILANANEISAAICASDGGQPTAVCQSAGVQAAAKTLPTSASQAPTPAAPHSPASSGAKGSSGSSGQG